MRRQNWRSAGRAMSFFDESNRFSLRDADRTRAGEARCVDETRYARVGSRHPAQSSARDLPADRFVRSVPGRSAHRPLTKGSFTVRSPRSLPYRLPLLAGLLAVVAAAGLVVYLQHQAVTLERQRTAIIVRQICERSVSALASRLSDLFGGAVLEAIEGIGHPELKKYNLARVDRFFRAGVTKFPYVDRFFLWHERAADAVPRAGGVLSAARRARPTRRRHRGRGGCRTAAFFGDPMRGAPLWRAARAVRDHGTQLRDRGRRDRRRRATRRSSTSSGPIRSASASTASPAISSNLEALRRHAARAMVRAGVEPLSEPEARFAAADLRVTDDRRRRLVYGSTRPRRPRTRASQPFDLLFFPRVGMEPYLASAPATPKLDADRAPGQRAVPVTAQSSVWLLAAVVLLLAVAVGCAVSVNRQAIRLSELQSDFVANVSHQLRTPLAMLSGAAETLGLERVRSPEKVREYADIVRMQAQRLSVLDRSDPALPSRRARRTRRRAPPGRSRRADRARRRAVPRPRRPRRRRDPGRASGSGADRPRRSDGARVRRREPARERGEVRRSGRERGRHVGHGAARLRRDLGRATPASASAPPTFRTSSRSSIAAAPTGRRSAASAWGWRSCERR